jgi:hypothetical protein
LSDDDTAASISLARTAALDASFKEKDKSE